MTDAQSDTADATPAAPTPDTGFDRVLAAVADVGGWMTDDQARRLWDRARLVAPGGQIVEIGSFQGRSMVVLASAAVDEVAVVAIDPHGGTDRGPEEITGYEAEGEQDNRLFHANLARAGVASRVRHLRLFSDEALGEVSGPIDLLYIDGAHRFAPARADLASWGDRVPVGGTLLVHDCYSSVGVTLAALVQLFAHPRFEYVGRSGTLTEYRCRARLGRRARVANAARQAAQLPYFAYNVVLKVMIKVGLGRFTRHLGHPSSDWPY